MPKKSQGLTRPITRAQANSYEKSYPNPGHRPRLGVTHLAELNGPGAYDEYHRRYEETRRILTNPDPESDVAYTAKQRAAMRKMSPARKAAFKKMLSRSPDISRVRRKKKSSSRKATPNKRKKSTSKKRRSTSTKRAAPNRRKSMTKRSTRRATPNRSSRPLKKDFVAKQMRKGRTEAQAKADWKLAYGSKISKRSHKGRQTRSYKGGYKALRADIGPKSRWTYKYATKKGQVRDIPDHALLGFKSRKAYLQAFQDMGEYGLPPKRAKRAAALEKKLDRLQARRERNAQKAYNRILAGKGTFTPNAEEITYEEFISMKPRRKKKKSTKKRRMRKNAARKTPQKRSKRTGRFIKGKARRKKATSSRKRKSTRRTSSKRKSTRKRKGRKVTGKKLVVYVSNRKRRRKTSSKKRRRSMKRNQGAYAANKRRRTKRSRRRTYRKNVGFQGQLMESLKLGGLVVGGIAAHRVLSNILDEQVLAKVEALNTGTIGEYRGIIGGALTAAIGIGATMALLKPKPGQRGGGAAAPIAAGMAASFLGGAIVTILKKSGQDKVAGYFANYPNAEGRTYGHAIGSYYTFRPHGVMSGMGSYYEVPQPMSGFGNPMLTQAAAGMGNPMLTQAAAGFGNPMLTQAAAGMGNPMLTQAAAGMGQPQISQAAAGTGEYVAYGVEGIGEYDEMPVAGMASYTDEGIAPNLHSAEQALSMAEAQAGVGSAEVPLQSTVNPTMIADPISNLPGGSRAGVFQGGDGIFG